VSRAMRRLALSSMPAIDLRTSLRAAPMAVPPSLYEMRRFAGLRRSGRKEGKKRWGAIASNWLSPTSKKSLMQRPSLSLVARDFVRPFPAAGWFELNNRLDVPASVVYRMFARAVVICVAIEVGPMPRHRTLVQFPPEVVAEIDKIVGARGRSAFLVDLAKREIKRQRLLKVFENREPIWKDEDHPEMGGDSDNWIRRMRTESEARFQRSQSHTRD
jgi:hypothetical protein